MKTGYRSAGDDYEAKRKHRAAKSGTCAIDELGDRGHLNWRLGNEYSDRQQENGSYLEVSRDVIARRQQHPGGQGGGAKAVYCNCVRKLHVGESEDRAKRGALRDIVAHGGSDKQQPNSNRRFL